jgi:hypothetical protein
VLFWLNLTRIVLPAWFSAWFAIFWSMELPEQDLTLSPKIMIFAFKVRRHASFSP